VLSPFACNRLMHRYARCRLANNTGELSDASRRDFIPLVASDDLGNLGSCWREFLLAESFFSGHLLADWRLSLVLVRSTVPWLRRGG
jgi:hypothetical protein